MKCADCGGSNIYAYKEVRQLIAEMGITKEDIEKMVQATVDSLVTAIVNRQVEGAAARAVERALGGDYRNAKIDVRAIVLREAEKEAALLAGKAMRGMEVSIINKTEGIKL